VKFLTFDELKSVKGIPYTRRHIRNLTITGEFPEPVTLGEGRIAWVEAEIDDWQEKKASARARQPPVAGIAPPAPPAVATMPVGNLPGVAPSSAQPPARARVAAVSQVRTTSKQPVARARRPTVR
jgi:predicted DNA-binding transcriptional regulator AlpA